MIIAKLSKQIELVTKVQRVFSGEIEIFFVFNTNQITYNYKAIVALKKKIQKYFSTQKLHFVQPFFSVKICTRFGRHFRLENLNTYVMLTISFFMIFK